MGETDGYVPERTPGGEISEHQPNRPFWDCTCCGEPWPCIPARVYIATTSDSSMHLAMMMWVHFENFVIDAGPGPLNDVFERFLGWARRPTPPASRT